MQKQLLMLYRALMKYLNLLLVLRVATAAHSDWTEVTNHVDQFDHSPFSITSFYENPGTYYWGVEASNWFTVTGSETQEPDWRLLFGNLCDNHWTASGDLSAIVTAPSTVYSTEDAQVISGNEVFTNGSDYVSRSASLHVTNFFYATVTPLGSGGTGGGN